MAGKKFKNLEEEYIPRYLIAASYIDTMTMLKLHGLKIFQKQYPVPTNH